ncbi:P-loop containing nucleoside triphosphate hydrolase protein [Filobasidium floriforme]|uniref:P-loop containing nucleoside triphosphate hydrolase protein n=1 Tax=Filobasidium floriforme TaxID=5210 RepID=UPI001E8D23FD|nr:P-loop containing nucleoside triphosphate hydrolase protein [Filobasidium floriforme]KAH8090622.1 P-loop containing nucleoside triphosphate hydrolase protein [Filobasidium floriforme]
MSGSSKSFVLSSLIAQRKQKKPLKSSLKTPGASGSKAKASRSKPQAKPSKVRAEELDWKKLSTDSYEGGTFDGDEGGMLLLEEVDGVDVQWEEDEAGRKKAVLMSNKAAPLSKRQAQKRKRAEEDIIREGPSESESGDDLEDDDEQVTIDATGPAFQSAFPPSDDEDVEAGMTDSDVEVKQEEDEGDSIEPDVKAELEATSTKKAKASTADAVVQPPSLQDRIKDIKFDPDLLPGWKDQPLHPLLKKSLFALGFSRPSDIQAKAVPIGLQEGRDVVGVAETGSGKTLAYSLPILNTLLESLSRPESIAESSAKSGKRELSALILCPTRELALQVGKVIGGVVEAGMNAIDEVKEETDDEAEALAKEEEAEARWKKKGKGKKGANKKAEQPVKKVVKPAPAGPRPPPIVSVATVVGGLSSVKQKRLVARGCDILVATPGRLWDLCEEDDSFASQIKRIKFLVIDEADRMIETGHFAELENIVGLTVRTKEMQTTNASEDDPTFARTNTKADTTAVRADIKTFVFSATLSKDLQGNLKRGSWRKSKKAGNSGNTLDDLITKLDFRDPKPEVIDISPEGRLVATLRESMVECMTLEKDLYLYYFLLRYPGRSLVFVGSIDGIRRLIPLFEMLKMPVYPLHSQLQQKQRLKNLDRFASSPNGILIATDVAARGLDIPSVDHVIHFQLPRTADAYIHRSGRTARAKQDGFSLQMVSPEERGVQKALMKSLGRTPELPELAIEPGFLPKLKERIRIAREIEKAQHQIKKENHDKSWLKEVAEAMDVDIDADMLSDLEENEADSRSSAKNKRPSDTKLFNLKGELNELLRQPLMARGVSAKYPTSGSRTVIDDLLRDDNHPVMLGASTAKAFEDVDSRPAKKARKFINKRART